MQRAPVILILLVLGATGAEARWRHHHHHSGARFHEREVVLPTPEMAQPEERQARQAGMAALVPRDWQLQPASPAWQGRRYVSPDGSAWIAFYATGAANDAEARFKAVAFGDGEELISLIGARDRLTVSGQKGDAMFYRKVMLACGGTAWRHVAMEYPASAQRNFEGFIARLSRAFERIADDACGESVFTHPQPVANAPKAEEKPAEQKPAEKKPTEKPAQAAPLPN
jgi:hypothetical protein